MRARAAGNVFKGAFCKGFLFPRREEVFCFPEIPSGASQLHV